MKNKGLIGFKVRERSGKTAENGEICGPSAEPEPESGKAPAKYGFPLAPPGDPAHIEAPACECPTGKVFRKMMRILPAINADFFDLYYGEALSALSAPCPCVKRSECSYCGGTRRVNRSERTPGGHEINTQDECPVCAPEAERDSLRARFQEASDEYRKGLYALRAENESLRARVDAAESTLAASTDLANSWAREVSTQEARDPSSLGNLIDRLWSHLSTREYSLGARVETLEAGGAGLIAAERQRQIEAEGWTPEHDDEHKLSELTRAAMVYARVAASQACCPTDSFSREPSGWPWRFSWWKPSADPIRNLVKAGALIAAEIDRLQRRAALKEGK